MTVAAQIKRMSKTTREMDSRMAKRLYKVAVALMMLYAADVWCGGERVENIHGKMARVQQMGAIQSLGAFQMTPNDILNIHTGMLPMAT